MTHSGVEKVTASGRCNNTGKTQGLAEPAGDDPDTEKLFNQSGEEGQDSAALSDALCG